MKRVSIVSLILLVALLLYLGFTLLYTTFFPAESTKSTATQLTNQPTPLPTFTPSVTATPLVLVRDPSKTPTPEPTPTSSPTPTPTDLPTTTPTATPTRPTPQVVSAATVNIRSGPGLNYPVVGTLPANSPLLVVGRNESGTWWQAQQAGGATGWVADSVVEAQNVAEVPVASAPPPPPEPTATPVPATPIPTTYQFVPTGWYGDVNYGLTRFLGSITDVDGNPVDGVFVEAQCGDYRIISNPSGPVGWGPFNESHTWPPGFYDITVDNKPVPCHWRLTVVATEDRETVLARLSETVEVETTVEQSIIVANWQMNW